MHALNVIPSGLFPKDAEIDIDKHLRQYLINFHKVYILLRIIKNWTCNASYQSNNTCFYSRNSYRQQQKDVRYWSFRISTTWINYSYTASIIIPISSRLSIFIINKKEMIVKRFWKNKRKKSRKNCVRDKKLRKRLDKSGKK